MTTNEILIRKRRKFRINENMLRGERENTQRSIARNAALIAQVVQLGFILSERLAESFDKLQGIHFDTLAAELVDILKKLKGADVEYVPFYPNFPVQVAEMDDSEWIINAIKHYWSHGTWRPSFEKATREFKFEDVKLVQLDLSDDNEVRDVLDTMVGSNDSLSPLDREMIAYLASEECFPSRDVPIPFAETKCFVAGLVADVGGPVHNYIKTTTDALRLATYFSGGDITLITNTKFNLTKRQRRVVMDCLDHNGIKDEDIFRHKGKWMRLFYALHPGTYSSNIAAVYERFRNGYKPRTFNGLVENMLSTRDSIGAVGLLAGRPTEFARRVGHLLEMKHKHNTIDSFQSVAANVPTRVLAQLAGHIKGREIDRPFRVIRVPGNKPHVLHKPQNALSAVTRNKMIRVLYGAFIERFGNLDPLGNVYVDPVLKNIPLPQGMRDASEAYLEIPRGAQIPFGTTNTEAVKDTLRFFIYWVGRDIDLSVTFHDAQFKTKGQVSWTDLKNDTNKVYHSGDITSAYDGAAEFIDLHVPTLVEKGSKYAVMNVLVYTGPSFARHEKVYAGWMTRTHPKSNEIFDAATVEQRVSLTGNTRFAVPVVFDLENRLAIPVDVYSQNTTAVWGNTVQSNALTIEQQLEVAVTTMDRKMSLYDLFSLHAVSRGTMVENKDDADTVFDLDIAFQPNEVNTHYVV